MELFRRLRARWFPVTKVAVGPASGDEVSAGVEKPAIEGDCCGYNYVVTWRHEPDGLRWRAKVFLGDELKGEPTALYTKTTIPIEETIKGLVSMWIKRELPRQR